MTITLYQNSLVTLEDAQCYFDERYDSADWYALEQEQQEKLLISASKKISRFDFVGSVQDVNQPLAFPRDYEIPQDIKDAVCEEAYALINSSDNIHQKNIENNISSISLGVGSVSYNTANIGCETNKLSSSVALYLVKKWVKKGYLVK